MEHGVPMAADLRRLRFVEPRLVEAFLVPEVVWDTLLCHNMVSI